MLPNLNTWCSKKPQDTLNPEDLVKYIQNEHFFKHQRVKMGTIVMKTISERVSKNLEHWIRIRVKHIQDRIDQERSRYIT